MALWGKTDALVSVPKWLETDANNTNASNDADNAVFVDVEEAGVAANRAKGLKTPGWNLYSNAGGRHRSEVLIAMKVFAADAGDAGVTGNTSIEDTIVEDGGGGGGTTTVTFAQGTDYSQWMYTGGGTPQIQIDAAFYSPNDLNTILNSGGFGIGTVVETSGGMVGVSSVTTTSAFVFDPTAAGGSGAWVAYFTVNPGSSTPTGGASSVTVTY